MSKGVVVLLLALFLAYVFSDKIFPDGFNAYLEHLADDIRSAVTF